MNHIDPKERAWSAPEWLREVDHTGDIGIRISAASQDQLFERAAWGMFWVVTDLDRVRPLWAERVAVSGSDMESLLLRWLSELNYLHITRGMLFCRFSVLELSGHRLVAEVSGEKYDPDRHTVFTEIKAVTFHGMEVRQSASGWEVQVIFDM
jgi:SHS2 domain-containing protein